MSGPQIAGPGPGTWILDDSHFERPLTRYLADTFVPSFHGGMTASFARYGVPLEEITPHVQDGFFYFQPRPVGAPPGASGLPPRPVFWLLTRLHSGLRSCRATAEKAFETKLWREDARRWEEEIKPRLRKRLSTLEGTNPSELDDGELREHLVQTHAMMKDAFFEHFSTNAGTMLPVGDFLVRISELSGLAPAEVGRALVSRDSVASEGDRAAGRLVELVRDAPEAKAILDDNEPAEALDALRKQPGEIGKAARAWLQMVENRGIWVGDLDGFNAGEVPHLLVEQLRLSLGRASEAATAAPQEDPVRARVPAAHHALYDELLAEAMLTYHHRDERCAWLTVWAIGLGRRTLLAAGQRLVDRGSLSSPELTIHCDQEELLALWDGKAGPSTQELEKRESVRREANGDDAPRFLGPPPSPPPPADWFPGALGRLMRAVNVYRSEMEDSAKGAVSDDVKGIAASGGRHLGTARIVNGPERFGELRPGDVLVARATMPAYNGVLPLLGGIVTDRGGSLSHAAIVSREFGIPGVVGCRDATKRIPDGATVLIDGDRGIVEVQSPTAAQVAS